MPDVHVTDGLVSELVDTFAAGQARLEGLVRAGLQRGLDAGRAGTGAAIRGDATQAYRERQLAQAYDVINELKRTAQFAPIAVAHAYRAGVMAVDRSLTSTAGVAGTFGGIHVGAVQVLAGNLQGGLTRAAETAQTSIEDTFKAAAALEGALSPRLAGRGLPADFIGRRTNDPFRKAALEAIGSGTVAGDTRRQVSAELGRRLVRDGTTDALTGFVDAAGKRWPLSTYAAMVTRTTTREAVTRATVNRISENGLDLVTISSHGSSCDICADYDGNTYSLDGATPGYEILDDQPPFHPNCGHVIGPADANLDTFERELQAAVDEPIGSPVGPPPVADLPAAAEAPAPVDLGGDVARLAGQQAGAGNLEGLLDPAGPGPGSPFGGQVRPRIYDDTADRLAIQRMIEADPGGDPAQFDSLVAKLNRDEKARRRALNAALGPDLKRELGRKWAKDQGLLDRFYAGDITREELEQRAYENAMEEEDKRVGRESRRELNYGLEHRPIPCFSCGRLKARPADVCPYCGDDPVPITPGHTHATPADRARFNADYGYAHVDTGNSYSAKQGYGR